MKKLLVILSVFVAQISFAQTTSVNTIYKFMKGCQLKEQAAPNCPPSGYAHVYQKTDGHMYLLNDACVEFDLTATLTQMSIVQHALGIKLDGDETTPSNGKFYGRRSGAKGFYKIKLKTDIDDLDAYEIVFGDPAGTGVAAQDDDFIFDPVDDFFTISSGGQIYLIGDGTDHPQLTLQDSGFGDILMTTESNVSNPASILLINRSGSAGSAEVVLASISDTAFYKLNAWDMSANDGDLEYQIAYRTGTDIIPLRISTIGQIKVTATNTPPGTVGAQTINKASGSVNFAAGAQTLVVTNNFVSTSSLIFLTVMFDDVTAKTAIISALSSGSFTIKLNAAATAETKVGFFVINY